MEMFVVMTVCWVAATAVAFVAGRLIGQQDRQEHIDFLRERVSKLSDRLDKLEEK